LARILAHRVSYITSSVRRAFDVDRVTKRFYDRFQAEHATFLRFIEGIPVEGDREWYASLMLNRLMFVYFIQKKGFLDNNEHYLRSRLRAVQEQKGNGNFLNFYRHFLLRLFHEGLGKQEHSAELEALLGKVPYLNGGLFDVHELERANQGIQIADEAFEKLFDFFDAYQWHLDERPLRADNEINPDVLGYIFEKYINQKQMGAYYTKEDITGYISKNTIIPFLFDAAENNCVIAFEPGSITWRLLQENPDLYFYEAVKKGVELPLPLEIAVGLDDVSYRTEWNKPAPEKYALPTEIWREVVARRKRYEEVRAKLASGEVHSINDLITYNLDIRQFAHDVIESSEGPELVRAFYNSITNVTILDPTCGSGAFLFAALNILEPLYEACLERMQSMVSDRDRLNEYATSHGRGSGQQSLTDFRIFLKQVEQHPNRRYFILKSIIINNLYGVDIMEEATEICKLRLFLKLAAQVERDITKPNFGLEPLPDIDFNIRAGNTLVGFATYEEAEKAISSKLDFGNVLGRIEQKAKEVERDFENFRKTQTEMDIDPIAMTDMKRQIREQLKDLNAELDSYLAGEYGIDQNNIPNKKDYKQKYEQWQLSYQPFHWFVEFYGIMKGGGFDVIIGNPPYVEYSKVRKEYTIRDYETESCGNLYAYVMERSLGLQPSNGRNGMIVPISMLCTERMIPLQKVILCHNRSWNSSFDTSPSQLFSGVSQRLSINLYANGLDEGNIYLGGYRRWNEEEREKLLESTTYVKLPIKEIELGYFTKIASSIERSIITKLCGQKAADFEIISNEHPIFVHRIIRYFIKAIDFIPYFWNESEGQKKSEDYKPFFFRPDVMYAIAAILNSSLFYWFWHAFSDGFHCGYRDVRAFRLGDLQESKELPRLQSLGNELMMALQKSVVRRVATSRTTGSVEYDEFNPRVCLPLIREIDRVLAKHYGFTDEELDFIINYDIKYRMGQGNSEEDE